MSDQEIVVCYRDRKGKISWFENATPTHYLRALAFGCFQMGGYFFTLIDVHEVANGIQLECVRGEVAT